MWHYNTHLYELLMVYFRVITGHKALLSGLLVRVSAVST